MQNKRNRLAFTLVELIVVIGILSVLSTISFMSYTGYVASSRDTKRRTDVSLISNALKKRAIQWVDCMTVAQDTSKTGTGWAYKFSFKGTDYSTLGSAYYKAGPIKMSELRDIWQETTDPSSGSPYSMACAGSDNELSTSFEETKTAYVIRSYSPRIAAETTAQLNGAPDAGIKAVTIMNVADSLRFRNGDIVFTGWSLTYTVDAIAGTTVYLTGASNVALIQASDTLKLYRDETGLLGNAKMGNGSVTAANTGACANAANLPNMAANQCPVTDGGVLLP